MADLMTVGEVAARCGLPAHKIREYEDRGLVWSVGRSQAGYRLFDETALWCAAAVDTLRSVGLTEAEIAVLAERLEQDPETVSEALQAALGQAQARAMEAITQSHERLQRIRAFREEHRELLTGQLGVLPRPPDGGT